MTTLEGFLFFMLYVFPPIVLIFGLVGNTLGNKVLLHKDLINIGPRDTYSYLLFTDSFYLLQIIISNLQYTYNIDLSSISDLSCKLWKYFNYSLAAISPWLIAYISLDRCISIQYPAFRFTLRKKRNQLIWFLIVIATCFVYYIPAGLYYNKSVSPNNGTGTSVECVFVDYNSSLLVSYMDAIMRLILPFCLMLIFSGMLIYSIFQSRRRIVENFLNEDNQTFYKEKRLAFSSITMNLIYIVTQTPVSITILSASFFSDVGFQISLYVFYMSYAINFYIILATNSLFRSRFFQIFK